MSDFLVREYSVSRLVDKKTGELKREQWLIKNGGLHHNPYGPAIKEWKDGHASYECWLVIGVKHRSDDLPAVISYAENTDKVIRKAEYWVDGEEHRVNKPSKIKRDYDTHKPIYLEYKQEGKPHRSRGLPAVVEFCPHSGTVVYAEFWENGHRHRQSGPAVIERDPNTKEILSQEFYVHGQKVDAKPPTPAHNLT